MCGSDTKLFLYFWWETRECSELDNGLHCPFEDFNSSRSTDLDAFVELYPYNITVVRSIDGLDLGEEFMMHKTVDTANN